MRSSGRSSGLLHWAMLCALGPVAVSPPAKKPGLPAATINDMYIAILDRQADTEGLKHYMDASHSGVGLAQVADELLRSKDVKKKKEKLEE